MNCLLRFSVRCYSNWHGGHAFCSPKLNSVASMEKDAFYVVRKGDIVGVYKSLSDCQAQVGSSVCDPSVSVFKGYSLPTEAEEYLVSRGLQNATYSISALDVSADIFGELMPCPFQHPSSPKAQTSKKNSPKKRLHEVLESDGNLVTSVLDPVRKHIKLETSIAAQSISSNCDSCVLEFDGASKGNPGLSGAGAVLRAEDGSVVYRLREGVGIATNNVAEYRAVILGLKYALKKGFKQICVYGDSNLVCMQYIMQHDVVNFKRTGWKPGPNPEFRCCYCQHPNHQVNGLWKTKNQNMADLCKEVKKLKDKFLSFQISHVLRFCSRGHPTSISISINALSYLETEEQDPDQQDPINFPEFNSEADAQANLAINLRDGEVQEDCIKK